jgi:hypothetical protein
VLQVCAGYVDDIFECAYAAISGKAPAQWDFPVSPTKAVMALLLSLFPSERETHIGREGDLLSWMSGDIIRPNLSSSEGFLTGDGWNSIWLYAARSPEHLIEHHETPDDPRRKWVWVSEPRTEPWTWYSMRAVLQVDLASPVAARILESEHREIPSTVALVDAQQILHRKSLELTKRFGLATEIVNYWADQLDKELAAEVREYLQPGIETTITEDAARWVRGERIEIDESAQRPGVPRRIMGPARYGWDIDGRPRKFWL